MSPKEVVKVDYCKVFLVTVMSMLAVWVLPMIFGKYADISFPYIPDEDITKEVVTADYLEKLYYIGKDSLKRVADQKLRVSPSGEMPLCPLVSPLLEGPHYSISKKELPPEGWTHEFEIRFAKEHGIQPGGFWQPPDCSARHTVTVIVGERNRTEQLHLFLLHMHRLLARQQLQYRIVVVQQDNNAPYNRGLLFNSGFVALQGLPSAGAERHCVAVHDVDLLPLNDNNLYSCARHPRHMTVAVNTFRYLLPYRRLCGGALILQAQQYIAVNGFSNRFSGWGGEDDNFCNRLEHKGLQLIRFSSFVSTYEMMPHAPAVPSEQRFQRLQEPVRDADYDGISSLKLEGVRHTVTQQPLMLHVVVTW